VKIATADGKIDPNERALLDRFAAHAGCGAAALDRMIDAALSGHFVCPEPADPTEARDWLSAIVRIAISDGTVDRQEKMLLKWLGHKANLSENEIDLLVDRVQSQQYAAARANL
jgi:tellurite resistance protein